MNKQTTADLMMVRPAKFSSNAETIGTNQFQDCIKKDHNLKSLNDRAIKEFENMLNILRENKLNVIDFNDDLSLQNSDAVFPNNWVTFHENNTAVIYPMMSASRRNEKREDILEKLVTTYSFDIEKIIDLSYLEQEGMFLEGTGSVIFDRLNKIFFACLSSRTSFEALEILADKLDYSFFSFEAFSKSLPIYHTNVMMSLGEKLAFICLDSIKDDESSRDLLNFIEIGDREVIEISIDQMNQFCGNVLEVSNIHNESLIIMSKTAFHAFTKEQRNKINNFAKIIKIPLGTIEKYGGGSARCMIAEIFLNKNN